MATTLSYSIPDFIPFTVIKSADVNSRFSDIKNRLNWDGSTATTGLGDDNIQSNTVSGGGLTRSTKLKAGTANYAVYNDAQGKLTEASSLPATAGGLGFLPTFTNNAGRAVVVNTGETGFTLGTPLTDILTESLASFVATLTAGESISANDAVCVDLHNGSGSDVYRVFKCDSDIANRKSNFLGFAEAAATVTPNIKVWTANANFVASNLITWTVNGRSYSQTFTTDNDTTVAAIAAKFLTDPDVQAAVVTDSGSNDRVITVTSKGGLSLNITTPVVTGGASQPSVVISQTQAASGQNVKIRCFGPMSGFSGLSVGNLYYLSSTSGAITNAPADTSPVFVGQAIDTTILFIPFRSSIQFSIPGLFLRALGGSTGATDSGYSTSVEHFNFSAWSTGTAGSVSRGRGQSGEAIYGGYLRYIDGESTVPAVTLTHQKYDKATWASDTNRVTARTGGGFGVLSSVLYIGNGSTGNSASGAQQALDSFNGSAWTAGVATLNNAVTVVSCFTQGSKVRFVGGRDSSSNPQNSHNTYNGSAAATDTAIGANSTGFGGSAAPSSSGIALAGVDESPQNCSRTWNGSAWSADISTTYNYGNTTVTASGPGVGYSSSNNKSYINGGESGSGTSSNVTNNSNGSTWTADTSSSLSRAGSAGGVL